MDVIVNLVGNSIGQVWLTLIHNWPFLLVSIIVAALLNVYVNTEKVSAFLMRYRRAGVVAATTAAVATPLCSCGTTAVVLGMLASRLSWAPIVAFMVASPLTSPQELVYSAGLFGWPFALAFFLSSIILGLAGGWVATLFENRGWLVNQTRFATPVPAACSCAATVQDLQPADRRIYNLAASMAAPTLALAGEPAGCGCAQPSASHGVDQSTAPCGCELPTSNSVAGQSAPVTSRPGVVKFLNDLVTSGRRLLVMFLGFAFIGYFLNGLIPASWVAAIFGSGHAYSVPLAATLGLPLYINTEGSLPLIRALLESGMSQGAALAFMISGAGTSLGAIAGALTIARWRVVALVVGMLWAGGILAGYAFDLLLALGLF